MIDEIKKKEKILSTFERNVKQIDELLEKEYLEVSIILIVSAFESFLGDIFGLCCENWFIHIKDNWVAQRKKEVIYDYLKEINILDEFIKKRYRYSGYDRDLGYGMNTDIADLYTLLDILLGKSFDDRIPSKNGKGRINFQNLNDKFGVRKAYMTFFNIDISKSLNENCSISDRMWEKLIKLFDERHDIVHKGKKTEFSEEDIRKVLDSIKFLKKEIEDKIINKTSFQIRFI